MEVIFRLPPPCSLPPRIIQTTPIPQQRWSQNLWGLKLFRDLFKKTPKYLPFAKFTRTSYPVDTLLSAFLAHSESTSGQGTLVTLLVLSKGT